MHGFICNELLPHVENNHGYKIYFEGNFQSLLPIKTKKNNFGVLPMMTGIHTKHLNT